MEPLDAVGKEGEGSVTLKEPQSQALTGIAVLPLRCGGVDALEAVGVGVGHSAGLGGTGKGEDQHDSGNSRRGHLWK